MDIIRDYGRETQQDRQKEASIAAIILLSLLAGPKIAKLIFEHAPDVLKTVKDHGMKYVNSYLASKGGLPPGAVESLRQEEEKNQPVVDDQALKSVQELYKMDGQHAVKSMKSVDTIQGYEGLQRVFDAVDVYEGKPSKMRRAPVKTKPETKGLKKITAPASAAPEEEAASTESSSIPSVPPSESGAESIPGEYLG